MEVTHHTTQTLEQKHENTDYVFAFKHLDWNAYHEFRPVYPQSMWSLWLDHHHRYGSGCMANAHDIGSGPGTAASILGQHFDHVFVSDAGAANLAVGRTTLTPTERFTFHHGPGESTSDWLPSHSVDLTCICMAFHYMDAEKTISAVASTLKAGGTLAAVTYGFRLLFPGNPRAQELWYKACSRDTLRLIKEGSLFPKAVRGLSKAMRGLDFVSFPPASFTNVRRVYINVDKDEERPLYFVESSELWQEAEIRVANGEKKEYHNDSSWGRQADTQWLRGFLASCQMGFDETTWALAEWRELEAIVNKQPEGKIQIEWPVSITLATKR